MTIEDIYSRYLQCGGRVTTDSRAIKGGEMFIALKGENFDGNAYAMKALEAGAACALVNEDSDAAASGDARVMAVPDTFVALKDLACWHRNHSFADGKRLTVIGLTGTNGKTTTKELIRAVLAAKYCVTATEGNLNNDIGVPLSLLKITPQTELAVIEMGANHPDDIAKLVTVSQPDYGLITNVGKAHLLGFGSFEGVKAAKGCLYDYVAAHEGQVFINADDADLVGMAEARQGMTLIPYGIAYDRATVLTATPEEPFLKIRIGHRIVKTRLVGAYNATNVMAALAVGRQFGVPVEDAVKAISEYAPANSRSQMMRTGRNVLIADAYNANPSSMNAALDNFASMEAPSKIALLGDMRELGEDSLREHVAIMTKACAMGCRVCLVGEEFRKAMAADPAVSASAEWFADSSALASHLREHPVCGATILVKGSRGIKMETAIPEL